MSGEPGWIENRESYRRAVRRARLLASAVIAYILVVIVVDYAMWGSLSTGTGLILLLGLLALSTGPFATVPASVRVDPVSIRARLGRRERAFPLNPLLEAVFFEQPPRGSAGSQSGIPTCLVYLLYGPASATRLGPVDGPVADALMAGVARSGGRMKVFSRGTLVPDRPRVRGAPRASP